jgi:uncharacterized protein (TIGR00661 family)
VASQLPEIPFVYLSSLVTKQQPKNVHMQPVGREAFLWYLQHPGAVVWATGGYMLPCEALSMGRKLLLTPTTDHVEQQMNADYLQKEFPLRMCACRPGTDEPGLLRTLLEIGRHEKTILPEYIVGQ